MKKKSFIWMGGGFGGRTFCDNPTPIVGCQATPPISWTFVISYAHHRGDNDCPKAGWYWGFNIWFHHAIAVPGSHRGVWSMEHEMKRPANVQTNTTHYSTIDACQTGALLTVFDQLDRLLTLMPNLAVTLSDNNMAPFWDAVALHIERRDWLADCRTLKSTGFAQQLQIVL